MGTTVKDPFERDEDRLLMLERFYVNKTRAVTTVDGREEFKTLVRELRREGAWRKVVAYR